ncbi:MAG: hypothetical protein IPJ06_14275 [Saprospiraceae bacterium]|nr:hypothetical protein [Saprospiraceae bacterium]
MMKWQKTICALYIMMLPMLVIGQTAVLEQIRNTVAKEYPGYTVDETEKETWCDGESLIEVEIEKGADGNEQELTLLFSADGKIRYREETILAGDLPKAVADGFRMSCPQCGDPREADKLIALDGGPVVYEVEGRKGLREYALILRENGELICRK